jgi:flagellar assembly factor FliW
MIRGPFGFEDEAEFLLIQRPEQFPLVYVQSVRTASLCFLALPVLAVDPEYQLQISAEDAQLISVTTEPVIGADVLCLALVTVHPEGPTANLLAPVLVNLQSRAALQCIHSIDDYSHQHPLTPDGEGVAA